MSADNTIAAHQRRTVSDVVSDLEQRIEKIKARVHYFPAERQEHQDAILYGALVAYEEAVRLMRTCRYRGKH